MGALPVRVPAFRAAKVAVLVAVPPTALAPVPVPVKVVVLVLTKAVAAGVVPVVLVARLAVLGTVVVVLEAVAAGVRLVARVVAVVVLEAVRPVVVMGVLDQIEFVALKPKRRPTHESWTYLV